MTFAERSQQKLQAWLHSPRALRTMHCFIACLSALFLGLFLYAALRRLHYPFEVEWIESGILVSVLRIAHGQGLYVRPTLDFVPYLYTPLYLYLAAAVTKLTGAGYVATRLVSLLSTLGSLAVIYALVRTETQRRIAAVAAAALYVACYSVTGGFFDIGRVDSLFVFLLLLALLLQRRGYPVLAALNWVLVFQTKQTVLPLAVFILLADWQRPRRALTAVLTFLVAVGASIILLNHATGGWYSFYVFHVAKGLPLVLRSAVLYIPVMLLEPLLLAWALIAAAALLTQPSLRSSRAIFYAFVTAALVGGVWFVEAHAGASANAMMPVFAWTAVLLGVSIARLLDRAESAQAPQLALLTLVAVAMQLLALVYNPGRYVPPQYALDDSARFIVALHSLPGDVYVVNHSYDAVLAGKQPHAEGEALGAVLDAATADGRTNTPGVQLRRELDNALTHHQFSAVVVDSLSASAASFDAQRSYPFAVSTGLGPLRYLTSQAQWFLLPCEADLGLRKGLMQPDAVISQGRCTGLK